MQSVHCLSLNSGPTCCTESDEGLRVFADQCQSVFWEGQFVQDVFDKVKWGDGSQVPFQFTKNHQLPLQQRDRERHKQNKR